MESATRFFDNSGDCIFCRTLAEELIQKKRMVLESEHFAAFVPYAGAAPFITWIFPRRHMASFGSINEAEMRDMAHILKDTLAKLYYGLNNPDYNYCIRSVPHYSACEPYYHWHIQILPRLTTPAGFEIGSGIAVNVALPEETAKFLREFKIEAL